MSTRRLPSLALLRPSSADRDLLRTYARSSDPSVFAELAQRYGGLAYRAAADVCPSAADDAAQATLTLLGRKAGALATRESAAGWVFQTARRLALKARTAAARRAKHESRAAQPAPPPDPLDALSFGEVRAAVAEEVARLPDELRVPLVLCYWRGDSYAAAATRLGCSLSTLKRRLDAGRERLAARLARRGFAGAAVLAVLTALSCRVGRSAATPSVFPVVPPRASASKLLFVGMTAMTVAMAGLALGLAPASDPPSPPSKSVETAKAPAAAVDAFGDPLPPGAVARLGTVRFRTADFPKHLAVSPDGKQIASTAFLQHTRLAVWEADTGRPIRDVELPDYPQPEALCWVADGRGLAAIKVGRKDYVVWQFTDPDTKPPAGERSNSFGPGTFTVSALSPDGTLIAGGERAGPQMMAGKLQVWPVRPGRSVREAAPQFTFDTADGFVALVFTRDGKQLIGITQSQQPDRPVANGGATFVKPGARAETAQVFVWNATTGKELTRFVIVAGGFGDDFSFFATRVAVSPDGKTLYTPTRDAHVKASDLATGKERFDALAFAPRGPSKEGLPVNPTQIGELAITPDGATLIIAEKAGRIVGLDSATGKERWRDGREHDYLYGLAVFPDGKRFALGHSGRHIEVYDATTGKPLVKPAGQWGGLTTVGITPDGRTAITGGWDHMLHHWYLATGKQTARIETESAARARVGGVSPDGKLAVGHRGIFDTATGKLIVPHEFPGLPPYWAAPGRVAWVRDGTVVVADEQNTAARYTTDGKKLAEYVVAPAGKPQTGPVIQCVAVAPDGKTVVLAGEGAPQQGSRSENGWVAVFDAATGAKRRDWKPTEAGSFCGADFLPDGAQVVLGRQVSQPSRSVELPNAVLDLKIALVLFDPATGEALTPFDAPEPTADSRYLSGLAVSPTGAQVVAVEADNSLTVYETATGAIRRRLRGHRGPIGQVTFTLDGGRLVSVSEDGSGLVWDMAPPRPAAPITTDAERSARWAVLLATDAETAHRAMGELIADPAGTIEFLKSHLKSTPAPTDADVDRLIARLGAAGFADRNAAVRELDAFGTLVVPAVRSRLKGVTSAEVRQRVEDFLKRHDRPGRTSGYPSREIRAVELLETIGTPEARAGLAALADEATPLGKSAAAAARRLGQR
jgi:RNA polymerase sigma factor (sigma-70 family)